MIRAIQFSNRRVGSTFLQNAIDSHTDIVGIDEVFVNRIREGLRKSGFIPYVRFKSGEAILTPREYIRDVVHKTYPETNTCFKLMYHQIHYHNGLYHSLTNGNEIKILHLMRKNLLKQVVSFYKMAEENHKPIEISADQLLNEVIRADQDNKNWANTFRNKIKLTLYFEDMIGKTEDDRTYLANNANVAVCDFFKVDQQQLFSKTRKKNKDDISVYLPNIDDIRKKFKDTEYEWMVE